MEEQRLDKTKIIKLIAYLLVFVVIIVIIRFGNYSNNKVATKTNQENNKIEEKIKKINEKYYSSNVYLTLDDDAITLNYQVIDNIEMGLKKYHGVNTEYTKKGDQYYTFNDGIFTRIDNFKDFEYDKTFMRLENIKKLLELGSTSLQSLNGNTKELIRIIDLKDTLKIYNEYNNTSVMIYKDDTIKLSIIYEEEKIDYIKIDTTSLYNLINKTEMENVIYKITFKEDKEEDTSWIMDKLN